MTIAVDAGVLARAWLSVYHASGKDQKIPALCRTMHVEEYPHGVRLIAADGFMLLAVWVPEAQDVLAAEPGWDEIPYASATVIDRHGRAASLMGYLASVTGGDDGEKLEVRLTLNVPWQPDGVSGADLQIDGFEALAATVEVPDRERLQLEVYEGSWVRWQKVLGDVPAVGSVEGVVLAPDLAVRLGRAAKAVDAPELRLRFGGPLLPVSVVLPGWETVYGAVMPRRDTAVDGSVVA